MALWAVQFGGFLFVIGAVAYLAYNLGYQVRKDEERYERTKRSRFL
ncbi:hypothetical protein [Leuconostoc lactis]|nr:hypothetical protein [Leuconostoc lactis]